MIDNDKNLIGTYGADPARWPEAARDRAERAFAAHPEAVLRAAQLDRALDDNPTPAPSDLLRARILKSAQSQRQEAAVATRQPTRLQWRRVSAFAATLAVCASIGFVTLSGSFATNSDTDWQVAASDLGITDLYDWVEGDDGAS